MTKLLTEDDLNSINDDDESMDCIDDADMDSILMAAVITSIGNRKLCFLTGKPHSWRKIND